MVFFAQEIALSPWTSLLWLAMQQLLSIKGISIRSLKTLFLTASIFNTEVSQLRSHVCLVGSAIPDISLLGQLVPCSAVHARQALVPFTYLSIQRSLIPLPPLPPPASFTPSSSSSSPQSRSWGRTSGSCALRRYGAHGGWAGTTLLCPCPLLSWSLVSPTLKVTPG